MMVAYNFSAEFAAAVESRAKRQTIRRSARCRPGDRLQLYTGQRTKACRKLSQVDPVCVRVRPVRIARGALNVDGSVFMSDTATHFAIADGFSDFGQMADWFIASYGKPVFDGFVIEWYWIEEA